MEHIDDERREDISTALQAFNVLPEADTAADVRDLTLVAYDCETSGLNVRADALLSMGAVKIVQGALQIDAPFEAILRQEHPSETRAILMHGLGRQAQLGGIARETALLGLLAFVGKAPLIAFHTPFDGAMLRRALREAFGSALAHAADSMPHTHKRKWLDLAVLCPLVFEDDPTGLSLTLDGWLDFFGIPNTARHDALGDAWATAQLWQITEAAGRTRYGIGRLREWLELQKSGKWMR